MSAKKKIAIAKPAKEIAEPIRKSQLSEFMEARIGPERGKLRGADVARIAGVTDGYISELRRGKKDAWGCSADMVCRLAAGMGESEVSVFLAIIGKMKPGITDEYAAHVMEKFSKLRSQDRDKVEFMLKKLSEMIDDLLAR